MNAAKVLENFPRNLVMYFVGLVLSCLDDYTLMTLTIFVTLLGFVVGSVLIAATAFFGLYFVLRLVANIAQVIGYHADTTAAAHRRPFLETDPQL